MHIWNGGGVMDRQCDRCGKKIRMATPGAIPNSQCWGCIDAKVRAPREAEPVRIPPEMLDKVQQAAWDKSFEQIFNNEPVAFTTSSASSHLEKFELDVMRRSIRELEKKTKQAKAELRGLCIQFLDRHWRFAADFLGLAGVRLILNQMPPIDAPGVILGLKTDSDGIVTDVIGVGGSGKVEA